MDKTKTENGVEYPKDAYLYVPDPESPSTWKIRIWASPTEKVTRAQLGAAAAALSPGGFRGQTVDIPSADLPAVKAKLRALYKSLDVKEADIPPHILKESAHPEEIGRWYGQYRQRLTEAGAAHTKAELAIIDNLMAGHDAMKGQLQTLRRTPKLHPAAEAMKRAYAGQIQETTVHAEGSLDQRICDVKNAYYELVHIDLSATDQPFVEEVFDDHLIVSKGDEYVTIPYTIAADGTVTFGGPSPVDPKLTYEPSTEPMQEAVVSGQEDIHLLESKSVDGSEWTIRVIKQGFSKNTHKGLKLPIYYSEAALKEATPLFANLDVYAHLTTPHINQPGQQSAHAKVGWLGATPIYDKGIVTQFTCVDAGLRGKFLESWNKGKRDFLGFSIDADGLVEPRLVEGQRAAWVTKIIRPNELSVVPNPAAGGELMRLVASADGPQKEDDGMERLLEMIRTINPALVASPPDGGWTEETLQMVLKEAMTAKPEPEKPIVDVKRLTEAEERIAAMEKREAVLTAKQHIRENLATHTIASYPKAKAAVEGRLLEGIDSGKTYTDEQIKAVADEQVTILAEASDSGKVKGLGGVASVTQEEREKMVIHAMDGLFEGQNMNSVPRFTSLHEAYCRITGKNYFDLDNRAIFRECLGQKDYDSNARRLTESIATSDWAQVFGDSITRKLLRDYNQSAQFDAWRSIVSEISSPKDFRTQRRVRIGGYGVLPAVSQGAPYQPLSSPGDEEATYTPSKRGGTEDLTWEDVLNDDIGAIRRIPVALARAAKITLYRFVMDLILSNPTIYDGDTLFHANHSNTFTNALSAANLLTAENAMLAQAAYGEATNNLGLTPRFFLTVRARRDDAWKLLTGDTAVVTNENATTPNIFKGKYKPWQGGNGEPFHVANYETSTTKYVLIADPQEIPTIEVGFLGGQQEPELFVQDDERVGSRFNADKITYKIRHVYSGAILDYRGFVQGNA